MVERTIVVDGVTLSLVVERKRVKNVNARLRERTLSVSAPLRMPETELVEIIPSLARRLLRRVRQRQLNDDGEAVELARSVAVRFPSRPRIVAARFVTTQRARWGSYSPRTGVIRLNAALREMPRWVLEAVVAHEIAHAVHLDHSAQFWALLRDVCPLTDRARGFLAGVAWLGRAWDTLPPVERALLAAGDDEPE